MCDKVTGKKYDNQICAENCFAANSTNLGPCPEEEPCACITLYDPVCDLTTGQEYSNRGCAVSCDGANASNLGPCTKPVEPLGIPNDSCVCTYDYRPVCDAKNVQLGANECAAKCSGYTQEQIEPCKPSQPVNPPQEACVCSFIYSPVCDVSGVRLPIAANSCAAKCQGYVESQFEDCYDRQQGGIGIIPLIAPEDCICPALYAPVCNEMGMEVASNACDAGCKGIQGFLPCEEFSTRLDDILPAGEANPNLCIATME